MERTILIIDDEVVDCLVHSKILERGNFAKEIHTLNSGKAALDYLNDLVKGNLNWPGYIFLDINMPTMNGFQFIEEYSKYPDFLKEKTKIFILSSSINPQDKEMAKRNPLVEDFIIKPLTLDKAESLLGKESTI